jgi:group I intron endonuclease
MMRHGSIYIATNKHTGEQYVGQTRQLVQKRWDSHWKTAMCPTSRKAKFQHALLEFGQDAFLVEEVFVAFDEQTLNNVEICFISELNPAYNATRGGKGLRPIVVTADIKRKRSEAAKARWANVEWRARTVESIRQAGQTDAARARGRCVAAIGNAARWEGHTKKPKPLPRVKKCKQKRSLEIGRQNSARAKWKPVYCPELQCSFLSQSAAAEYLGVLRTSVANAVKQKGKLLRKYSLERVA